MKKLLFGLIAAAGMLFASSCSEELEPGRNDAEARITFSLGTENAVATRAISNGSETDMLVYQVFDQNGAPVGSLGKVEKSVEKFPCDINLTLAKGQTYQIVFWAQNSNCKAYNTDKFPLVKVDYAGINNDEARDAFFKAETFTVTGDATIEVELKRPFAQLNVGVTAEDWTAAVASGIEVIESSVVIENAGTSIDLLSGKVNPNATTDNPEVVEVKYTRTAIPEDKLVVNLKNENGEVAPTTFHWLSMSYILIADGTENGQGKATLDDVNFTFYPQNGNPIVLDAGLNNVPVQRNWRTNILGQLLTGDVTFHIILDPIYDNEKNIEDGKESDNEIASGVKYDAATKTFSVYSAEGLQWIAKVSNGEIEFPTLTKATANSFAGYTVALTSDIDLKGINWTPIGTVQAFDGTFDGGNNTISNLTVKASGKDYAGLFAKVQVGTIKNVRIKNANISGQWNAAALVASIYGTVDNCHVDGGIITSTPHLNEDGLNDDANNVGGLVGYLAEGTNYIKNSSVQNMVVTAYRDVAGLVGKVNTGNNVVENNTVSNVDVIADQTVEYYKERAANAGEIVGSNMPAEAGATLDLSTNTVNNVTVSVLTGIQEIEIYTAEELFAVATLINNGQNAKNLKIKLMNDIDLGGRNWDPIWIENGHAMSSFVIDGNNKKIIGMTINKEGSRVGFIGLNGTDLTVSNLTFEKPRITVTGDAVGAMVGELRYGVATFTNVDVVNAEFESTGSTGQRIGGLVGFTRVHDMGTSLIMTDCDVKNSNITGYQNLGGLAGFVSTPMSNWECTLTNCTSTDNTFFYSCFKSKYTDKDPQEWAWHPIAPNGVNSSIITTGFTESGNVGKLNAVTWNTTPTGATEENPAGTQMTHEEGINNAPAGYKLPTEADADMMLALGKATKTEEGWTIEFNGQTIHLPFNRNNGSKDYVYYWVSDVINVNDNTIGLAITDLSSEILEVACYHTNKNAAGSVIYVQD